MKNLLLITILAISFSCKKKYEEGFAAGRADGQADGRVAGYDEGFAAGNEAGLTQGYTEGFAEGSADGEVQGYADGEVYFATAGFDEGTADGYAYGYANGNIDGFNEGYTTAYDENYILGRADGNEDGEPDGAADGYADGIVDGEIDGYNTGYDNGYDDNYWRGYNNGYDDGEYSAGNTGYSSGYNSGYNSGYSSGYDDGEWDSTPDDSDGYGSSAKSSNPQVRLISMINQDLFEYSKLQKFDPEAATMVMSHADNGTVDMGKLAALKEQHYLNQMAYKINAKFGLSTERSKEIAKVAHQFNKLAGSRELTEKDADIFANEVIGVNLKDVEVAVKESMKGNSELLNKVLGEIASKNGTSPETMNAMINSIFF